jgi:hypothetical protein
MALGIDDGHGRDDGRVGSRVEAADLLRGARSDHHAGRPCAAVGTVGSRIRGLTRQVGYLARVAAFEPGDWPERQRELARCYGEDPWSFGRQPVHVRWWANPAEWERHGRGFVQPEPVRVAIWASGAGKGALAPLIVELPNGALVGSDDADIVGVGDIVPNGALALLFADGVRFPSYNPRVPARRIRL